MTEWIGYLASIIVAVSITINGWIYFRVLNLIGSVCFLIYAFLISSYPIVFINIYGIGINIFYLIKLKKERLQMLKNEAEKVNK